MTKCHQRSKTHTIKPSSGDSISQTIATTRLIIIYFISILSPPVWLTNSGAYWHCNDAIPLVYVPAELAHSSYSKTYVPFGK